MRALGAAARKAAPYIELSGKKPEPVYVQASLLKEADPETWRTGLDPYQQEKITSRDGAFGTYEYPGVKGKRLNYVHTSGQTPVIGR